MLSHFFGKRRCQTADGMGHYLSPEWHPSHWIRACSATGRTPSGMLHAPVVTAACLLSLFTIGSRASRTLQVLPFCGDLCILAWWLSPLFTRSLDDWASIETAYAYRPRFSGLPLIASHNLAQGISVNSKTLVDPKFTHFHGWTKAQAMQFLGEECSACCTAGDFTLVSSRDDHDDDEKSFFCLGATVSHKLHRVQWNVRGQEPTVALCLRTAVHRLFTWAIPSDKNCKHPLKGKFSWLYF